MAAARRQARRGTRPRRRSSPSAGQHSAQTCRCFRDGGSPIPIGMGFNARRGGLRTMHAGSREHVHCRQTPNAPESEQSPSSATNPAAIRVKGRPSETAQSPAAIRARFLPGRLCRAGVWWCNIGSHNLGDLRVDRRQSGVVGVDRCWRRGLRCLCATGTTSIERECAVFDRALRAPLRLLLFTGQTLCRRRQCHEAPRPP
jgi:hypothetical protein